YLGNNPLEVHGVIADLEIRELEAVRSRDHHDAITLRDDPSADQLAHGSERDSGVGAVEESRSVGMRARLNELGFAGLFDDAVVAPDRVDCLLDGDRVSDLD